MLTLEEALTLIREHVVIGPSQMCEVRNSLGLALAQDVVAKADSPRFDASSVDGYAVSLSDFEHFSSIGYTDLPIVKTVHAGDSVLHPLKRGTTVRLFTGATVPRGADAIVMQEYVKQKNDTAHFLRAPTCGDNIRRRGGEFTKGTRILDKGTLITPPVLGTLAALGYNRVRTFGQPRISVIVTGDELQLPGSRLKAGEIWDSTSFSLPAAIRSLGIAKVKVYPVRDSFRNTVAALRKALAQSDFVITSGGVSVGDRDYIRRATEALGIEEIFWQIKMKPGKPVYFGIKKGNTNASTKYVFGLPGNPVSVMATFQFLVRPAILRRMGIEEPNRFFYATLDGSIRKAAGRLELVRAIYRYEPESMFHVRPLRAQESHMTTGLANANCVFEFPLDLEKLEAGERVRVHPLQWSLY